MAYTAYLLIGPTSGGAGIKGAYTQIVASTPYASSRLYLDVEFAGALNRFMLADLATGAAGSETVIVANIAFDSNSDQVVGSLLACDVDVPAGTRLAIRIQQSSVATTQTFNVYLESRALASLATPVTYGTDLGNTRGTQIDPGGTAGVKGSYVQLTASTSARIDVVTLCLTIGTAGSAITTGLRWSIDIATGGAGSETIVLPDVTVVANTPADCLRPAMLRFPVAIPAGTRLAARALCSVNTAIQRLLCVTLIGMQEPATSGGGATSVAYLG